MLQRRTYIWAVSRSPRCSFIGLDILRRPSVPVSSGTVRITCLGLAVGALDATPQQQVELLIGAAELERRLAPRPSHSPASSGVEQCSSTEIGACAAKRLEKSSRLQQLADRGGGASNPNSCSPHRHVEPLAVEAHLETFRIQGCEAPACWKVTALASISDGARIGRVGLERRSDRPRARCRSPTISTDGVAEVLKLTAASAARPVKPRWISGAVGSIPSFTRNGRPAASLRSSSPLRQAVDRVAGQPTPRSRRAWEGAIGIGAQC